MGLALAAAIAVVILLALVFNNLVMKRNRCEKAFATVDVMLKKRYDLIPNLVGTVKGYAAHERGTLERITELRAKVVADPLGTDDAVALENEVCVLLRRLLLVAEDYPELRASENFMQLQRALNEAEEQLSAARRAYNAAVTDLNNAVQMLPSSLVASLCGFRLRRLLETEETERAAPDVRARLGNDGGGLD
jgi:LemA protein